MCELENMTKFKILLFLLSMLLCPFVAMQAESNVGENLISSGIEKKTIVVDGVSFTMVMVEGGTFSMGATKEQIRPESDEIPIHDVTLSSFYIAETEVTIALWDAVMKDNSCVPGVENNPKGGLSWDDCKEFISRLNKMTGYTFRMPTEAEWEYAARGGNRSQGYMYAGSDLLDEVAWYRDNSDGKAHAVAQKKPNELGLYDMSGNVYECCQDWYGSYTSKAQSNPKGPAIGSNRVFRGGSRNCHSSYNRVSFRSNNNPSVRYRDLGLRLALSY